MTQDSKIKSAKVSVLKVPGGKFLMIKSVWRKIPSLPILQMDLEGEEKDYIHD